ncbi:Phosphorylase superfamily protein [Chitinasiproducens palmae]|uniref:Phosphorylase superfamily protein n=1 Tax=Chitinasiproducens palmae TaxID=1770053 RepID=A0A1H2PSE5_9BURK|nr:Phosphorylase superfamily protein [Chitinasiproducens palmae]
MRLVVVTGLAFEARLARAAARGLDGVQVIAGLGAAAAAAALDDALRDGLQRAPQSWPIHAATVHAPCVLSFGTAGALDPGLRVGDWIVADALREASGGVLPAPDRALRAMLATALPDAHRGSVIASRTAVATRTAKAALAQASGALAVDMESDAIASMAAQHGLRFGLCRVVIDEARRSLPPAALAGMRSDGSASVWPVIAALLRRPHDLPGLLALARNAAHARRALRARARTVFAACLAATERNDTHAPPA